MGADVRGLCAEFDMLQIARWWAALRADAERFEPIRARLCGLTSGDLKYPTAETTALLDIACNLLDPSRAEGPEGEVTASR